jgi:hypothetical protein
MLERDVAHRLRRRVLAGALIALGVISLSAVLAAMTAPPAPEPSLYTAESCRKADASAVKVLKRLIEIPERRATIVSSNVFRNIVDARRYCRQGEPQRAMELYALAGHAVRRFHQGMTPYEE